ncbi:MAG: L,D-transpeptidase [Cellulosilyticaceae bacterium]
MKKVFQVIMCYLFLIVPLFAAPTASTLSLGTLQKSKVSLNFNDYTVETYTALDGTYVPVSSLKDAGLAVNFTPASGAVQVLLQDASTTTAQAIQVDLSKKSFDLYANEIWLDRFKSHGIVVEGRVLVPVGALRSLFDISIKNNISYHMTPKTTLPITATKDQIINDSDYPLIITVTDLYWNKGSVQKTNQYLVGTGETFTRPKATESGLYITTVITSLVSQSNDKSYHYTNNNLFGQTNDRLFQHYTRLQSMDLSDLGDPIDMAGVLWAEDTINSKNLSSSTPYLIWTNIDKQRTYIFEGSKNNWTLMKHFKCSTGRRGADTPKGQFKLTYKVPYFGVEKGYRCKNAFGFIGTTYLYHSVMFDKTGTYLLQGKGELGSRASAGCIRLSVPHSEWFYNNMVSGSTVIID